MGPIIRIHAAGGTRINEALDRVVHEAAVQGATVVCEFNGVDLEAKPGMTPSTVEHAWSIKRREIQQRAASERHDRGIEAAAKAISNVHYTAARKRSSGQFVNEQDEFTQMAQVAVKAYSEAT